MKSGKQRTGRGFNVILAAALPFAFGCMAIDTATDDFDDGVAEVVDDDAADVTGTDGTLDGDDASGGDGPSCTPTAPNVLGPYYREGAPERSDLVEEGMPGTRLEVTGIVTGTDCVPIAGALLDFWQANDVGVYDNTGWTLRGRFHADGAGHWTLRTIVPGRYDTGGTFRPEHLHVRVSSPGHALLTTQLYFPDDPFNAGDPFFVPSLTLSVTHLVDGSLRATFDFALEPG